MVSSAMCKLGVFGLLKKMSRIITLIIYKSFSNSKQYIKIILPVEHIVISCHVMQHIVLFCIFNSYRPLYIFSIIVFFMSFFKAEGHFSLPVIFYVVFLRQRATSVYQSLAEKQQ